MTSPRHCKSRAGFTLTELLVAITVLAILAGFLAPAVINALVSTKESAVVFEMKQIELALEQFKNDHGFYPPTIDVHKTDPSVNTGAEIQSFGRMKAYLNKIAPQNAESSTSFVSGGPSRLEVWWENVGKKLDERSSLPFWLSGLCKNKQYPLTGGANATLAGFGADQFSDGSPFPAGMEIDRDNYFEFKGKQLRQRQGGAVAFYQQPYGPSDGDLDFRYLDYKSYFDGSGGPRAYCDGFDASSNPLYLNPKSFQLVTFGRDGLPGNPGDVSSSGSEASDNICNFTEGRLEKYDN